MFSLNDTMQKKLYTGVGGVFDVNIVELVLCSLRIYSVIVFGVVVL